MSPASLKQQDVWHCMGCRRARWCSSKRVINARRCTPCLHWSSARQCSVSLTAIIRGRQTAGTSLAIFGSYTYQAIYTLLNRLQTIQTALGSKALGSLFVSLLSTVLVRSVWSYMPRFEGKNGASFIISTLEQTY